MCRFEMNSFSKEVYKLKRRKWLQKLKQHYTTHCAGTLRRRRNITSMQLKNVRLSQNTENLIQKYLKQEIVKSAKLICEVQSIRNKEENTDIYRYIYIFK